MNIKDRRISKATKEREETYFEGGARRLKDMGRQEIIATEKALNPNDF